MDGIRKVVIHRVPPVYIEGAKVKDVEPGEYGYIDPKDIWVDNDRKAYMDPEAPIYRRDEAVKFHRFTLHYAIYLDGDISFKKRDEIPENFIPVDING